MSNLKQHYKWKIPRFQLLNLYAVLNLVLASTNQSREAARYSTRRARKRCLKHKNIELSPLDFSVTLQLLHVQSTIRNQAEFFPGICSVLLQISAVRMCSWQCCLMGYVGIAGSYFSLLFSGHWLASKQPHWCFDFIFFRSSMPFSFLTYQTPHAPLFFIVVYI